MSSLEKKPYSWNQLMTMILSHRRELAIANLIAVLGAVTAVPVPLLIPLLVDEVLLQKPGSAVSFMNSLFPENWHGPILYITAITLLTLFLRLLTLIFGVWQTREFTLVAKDITFRLRQDLLNRLQTISMAEYETIGSGAVASHLVTDIDTIDEFIGSALSKFLVALLLIMGVAAGYEIIEWWYAVLEGGDAGIEFLGSHDAGFVDALDEFERENAIDIRDDIAAAIGGEQREHRRSGRRLGRPGRAAATGGGRAGITGTDA